MTEDIPTNLPQHIAFIPDGNRRWARAHGLPLHEGHLKGHEAMMNLAKDISRLDIKYFTIWYFSTETWTRAKEKGGYIIDIALEKIDETGQKLIEEEIGFRHLGRRDRIPKKLASKFTELEQATAKFDKHYLNLAFDYGGREEIVHAVKEIIKEGYGELDITEDLISSHLYTKDIPDPDLIIRTSGEKRLSGYLPWQGVYSELYFADVHCPDFNFDELKKALWDYSKRERRKGGDSSQQSGKVTPDPVK